MPATAPARNTERRSRGRPPLSEAEVAAIRARVVAAARRVFARIGYHGLSVELLIEEAGVSRPTFYKYFSSLDEVVELLIAGVNEDLIKRLMAALMSVPEPVAKVEAAIIAWREWGESLGAFLRPFYAELHNQDSIVGRQRRQTLAVLTEQIAAVIALMGRPRPGALQVATFLNGVEYLGYHYHLETRRRAADWKETRDAMFRLALGLLGSEAEWSRAMAIARDFGIDLQQQ